VLLEDVVGNVSCYSNRQFSQESDFLLFIIPSPHGLNEFDAKVA